MPDIGEHLAQARHNEDVVLYLGGVSPDYVDWQMTGLFYAALHYVDAYFVAGQLAGATAQSLPRNLHPRNHAERDQMVSRHLPAIQRTYRLLKDHSIDARYQIGGFTPRDIMDARDMDLVTIRHEVGRRLGISL